MWKCLESLGASAWNHLVLMIKNWRVGMQIMGEQQQLQSLVHELKWSYVALWSFNSGNRNLEWRAGHWRQTDTQGWDEQCFNSTFKSCKFGTRFGSVGLAFAERRKLWMNGSKVVDNAGSKELVDFLRRTRILTAIFIPWSDGVLELGTSENVPENSTLVDEIERYFLNKIVPTLPMLPPMPLEQQGYSSLSPLNYSQSFEPNSLNRQITQRGSNMNPDMFLHGETSGGGAMLLDASKVWKMQTTAPVYYPPVQQRTRGQYRSRSNTTSSSVSSLDERLSAGDSPEQLFMASSSQRQTSVSNTSSSPTRAAGSHSPEMNQLEVTRGPMQETRVEEEFQDALNSMMLAAGAALDNFPSLETSNLNALDSQSYNLQSPFTEWRQTRIQKRTDGRKQYVLRRCIEIMKQISPSSSNNNNNNNNNSNVPTQNDTQAVIHNVGQHGPRVASSSSPETIPNDPFDQVPPRVQRRPRGGSRIASMGAVHSGHDEAAMNHMLAERRRRVKQKENFAALRRLVPIISKADKASILGDAIVYLKDLQDRIEGLQMNRAESERRYEELQKSHKELQERNKELESMVHNPVTRLRSI